MSAHNNLHALLFQATGAEYIALCRQAYQLARHALLTRLESGAFRNPAVIFDVDETVLDNHAFQASLIAKGENFDEKTNWRRWCNAAQAEAVPGAIEFIRFVEEAGATPIFITSRENLTRQATLKNLHALGAITDQIAKGEEALLPHADHPDIAHRTRLFMKGMKEAETQGPSGPKVWKLRNKFDQRIWLEGHRGFEVILSVGDNLGDYAEYYGKIAGAVPGTAERRDAVLQDAPLIGRDFILIPNATYGGWLRAFEANQIGASDELAATGAPVREALQEPQEAFTYMGTDDQGAVIEKTATAKGPKFVKSDLLRIWS